MSDSRASAIFGGNDWLNDSSAEHPMAALLEEIERSLREPTAGEIRTGTVVEKRPNEVLIDIGFKSEGVVSGRELERLGETLELLKVGDEVPVFVMREDKDGNLVLSISRALAEKDWERAEELMRTQDIFECPVDSFNRGGVIVKLGQVRGFVPASQLSSVIPLPTADEGDERYAALLGGSLRLKVIDIDRKRNRLILSERLAMREWRRQQKEQLLESLKEGDSLEGVISSIADFGAFVDLGGADGLIHLSELSWNRVSHPSEIVKVGERVKVQVLSVDTERRRIGLSLRRLTPQPWEVIDTTYEVGQVVRGRITKLVNFGAFARLVDTGIEGLIHISELSDRRVTHPKEVVSEGDVYDLRIIRIEGDKRRLGLSLKQALPVSQEIDWQIAPSENGHVEDVEDVEHVEDADVVEDVTVVVAEAQEAVVEIA
jgi:small subunit ribosomal protein S1